MPEEKVSRSWRTDMLGNDAPAADAEPRQPGLRAVHDEGLYFDPEDMSEAPPVPQEAAPKTCLKCGKPMADTQVRCLFCDAYEPEPDSAMRVHVDKIWRILRYKHGRADARDEVVKYLAALIRTAPRIWQGPVGQRAIAPDWAMGVAEQAWEYDADDSWNNKKEWVTHVAALIREAGSERERELHAQLRQAIKAVRDKRGGGKFGKDDDGWWDLGDELEQAVETVLASRLLGGESK